MNDIPAFPAPAGGKRITKQGMTLRDYFAAKAMQGLLAHGGRGVHYLEESSYYIANKMMEAREKNCE